MPLHPISRSESGRERTVRLRIPSLHGSSIVAVGRGVGVAVGVTTGVPPLPPSPHAAAKTVTATVSTMRRMCVRMGRLQVSP